MPRAVPMLTTAVAALAALGLAACGSSKEPSASAGPAGGKPDVDGLVNYARCMRKHGVDMPDPQVSGKGVRMAMRGRPGSENAMKRAQEACRSVQGAPREPSKQELAEARDNALKVAKCMRKHGIDVPDPGSDGAMRVTRADADSAPATGGSNDAPRMDPAFQRALKACGGGKGPLLMRLSGGPGK